MQDSEEAVAGKAAVRALLIERITEAGLKRARGVAATVHEAALERLVAHFSYMTPDNLRTLAEVVIDNADAGICPSEVVIRSFGEALQTRPQSERRIISSWLASVEGPVAEAGGWLVELYRFLRGNGRPPLAMDLRQLKEAAVANDRRCRIIRDRMDREVATDEDRGWLAAYLGDRREAQAIVDQGKRGRVEKREQGNAA